MATTKQRLFTGRTVEIAELEMKHFDLFLESMNQNKPLLIFYIELLIDNDLLVAVDVSDKDGQTLFPKDEKEMEKAKLSLLPCEVYEIMYYVRQKSLGNEVSLIHEWQKGKPTTYTADLSKLEDFIIETKMPSKEDTLTTTLSDGKVITIQKGTIGQLRKHSHNVKKGNATEMIAMHNPKQERTGESAGKPAFSLSISELKKLSWKDSPKLMKLCGEANGSYSIHLEVKNPQDKTETKKIDLLSYEGFAGFFDLQDNL